MAKSINLSSVAADRVFAIVEEFRGKIEMETGIKMMGKNWANRCTLLQLKWNEDHTHGAIENFRHD
jgi:hypothetical protein